MGTGLALTTLGLALSAVSSTAQPPLLLVQPPTQAGSSISDLDCGICDPPDLVAAEDFVLATEQSLGEVVLWGGYKDDEVFLDRFRVQLFLDDQGLPDPPALATWVDVPVERVATGETLTFVGVPLDEYRYRLRLPQTVLLPPGTYWLEIANDSTGQTGDFVWGFGTVDASTGRAGSALHLSLGGWLPAVADLAIEVRTALVFEDGFESGDFTGWTTAVS